MVATFIIGFCLAIAVHSIVFLMSYVNLMNRRHVNHIIVNEPQTNPVQQFTQKNIETKVYSDQNTIRDTSQENIDLVISGLTKIGVKKSKAKSIVSRMCKDKCYDDAQDLFEACFPYINS